MNKPHYVPVYRRTKEEILKALSSQNPQEIRDALVSAGYWENDWKWAEDQLLKFSEHESGLVLWAVATGLGLIAAFHGDIDEELVRPVLARLRTSSDSSVGNAAEESEADIDHFVKARKEGNDISLATRLSEHWRPPEGNFPQN
jgi:hypothetical protein